MSLQQNKIPLFKKFDLDPDGAIAIKLFDYVKSYSPVVRDRNGKIYRFFSRINHEHVLHSNILTDVFKKFNLDLTYAAVICALPFDKVPIHKRNMAHTDHTLEDLALNWPMKNCEQSKTFFFESKVSGKEDELFNGGGSYTGYDQRYLTYLDSFVLDKPTILNVKVPHKVENYSSEDRWALSLRFSPDPWHLLM